VLILNTKPKLKYHPQIGVKYEEASCRISSDSSSLVRLLRSQLGSGSSEGIEGDFLGKLNSNRRESLKKNHLASQFVKDSHSQFGNQYHIGFN
jgi:hypothetical protein